MSKLRVAELAKELGLDNKTAVNKMKDLGIPVVNHFSGISDQDAAKFRNHVKGKGTDPAKMAAAPKLLIRRKADAPAEAQPEPTSGYAPGTSLDSAPSAHVSPAPTHANANESAPEAATPERSVPPVTQPEASLSAASVPPASENPGTASPSEPMQSSTQVSTPSPATAPRSTLPTEGARQAPASSTSPQARAGSAGAGAAPAANRAPGAGATSGAQVVRNAPANGVPTQRPASPAGSTAAPRPAPAASAAAGTAAPAGGAGVSGAVIVRKAENLPPPAPPSVHAGVPGRAASFGQNAYQGGRSGGGYQGGQQGGGYQGGGAPRSGGWQPREGGAGGGYQNRGEGGGYQNRGEGGGYQNRGEGGGYQNRGEGGGYQPRPPGAFGGGAGGAPGAGGTTSFRTGGFQGNPPRPGGPGGDRPPRPNGPGAGAPGSGGGYRPAGGPSSSGMGGPRGPASALAAIPAADPATGKEVRRRDHDKDKRPRSAFEEEESRRNALKSRGRDGVEEDFEAVEGEGDSPIMRTLVPGRRRPKKRDFKKVESSTVPMRADKRIVEVDETISVNDLAGQMSVKAALVIKALFKMGMMASINQVLDLDTTTLVAQEFGYEVRNVTRSIEDILKDEQGSEVHAAVGRPPVVTIMGHVDHGKTSLLDAIRSSRVADREAGGITQHIGAYQVTHNDKKITFIDTPGHEAFTNMRARGAQATDIVILVVAADDGVMPQTIEAISHAKAANVPIIVAINKIDKGIGNLDRLYRDLADKGVMSEEWGGESMFVKVSAKSRQGIPDLLESILLQADVMDLQAPESGYAEGVVIESRLDKSRGPVATVLVTKGTLRISDWVVAGTSYGRLRAMSDDRGTRMNEAAPSTPVEILGLDAVPAAGDQFHCVANDQVAKEAVEYRIEKQRQKEQAANKPLSREDLLAKMGETADGARELNIILKADTHGSAEAIRASIKKLDTVKVKTKVIHSAVGGITETDVTLARASDALILGFNVRPERVAAQAAEQNGISIQCYSIIYELIQSVEAAMLGKLAPVKVEKVLGHAEIRNLFTIPKVGVIAGSFVIDGKIIRNSTVRVVRDGVVIYANKVSSLKRFKDDAKEVLQGFECGIGVENFNDLKVGDVLESFIIDEVAPTLN